MLSTITFLLLILSPIIIGAPSSSFQFLDCGGPEAIVKFTDVSISPSPVYFDNEGESTIVYKIASDLPAETSFYVDTWTGNRLSEANNLKDDERTPCLFGPACEFSICDWMTMEFDSCMKYHNSESYCKCPVKAGIRSDVGEKFIMASQSQFPSWFNSGTYTARFTIIDAARKQIGCLLMSGSIATKSN
ncbi:uncharacterized protein LOC128390284 [Panonychus citri]|uniref:uncharacterized protein LOC128390284 n=1 Tax=Panonychus citri TaxID=50023 RepID=UPI002307E0DA|nr:uncharacterized protein LOC128390284 [Panonychus citri]